MEDLSQEERGRSSVFSELIEIGSPDVLRVIRELLEASFVKGVLVLSYSSNFLRWIRGLPNIALYFLREGWGRLHDWKVSIKSSVERAGWKGLIFVWVVGHIGGTAVEAAINISPGPAELADLLVALIANGARV